MKEKINVLIVDDLELAHEPIQKFLQDFVFSERQLVTTNAYNTIQAKRYLKEKVYDIVMLDGDVSGTWGYEIIQDIKDNNNNILIVSSSNHDNFNKQNIDMGADESVNKIYLYEWNDEYSEVRIEKAKAIKESFRKKNQGTM